MNIYLRILIIAPVCVSLNSYDCVAHCSRQGPSLIPSWDALEDELRHQAGEIDQDFLNRIREAPVLNGYVESENTLMWDAMLVQGSYPLVALAGYAMFRDKAGRPDVRAAVRVLANAERPGLLFYGVLFLELDEVDWSHIQATTIANEMHVGIPRDNISVIIRALPIEIVQKLFELRQTQHLTADMVASVLDRLFEEYESQGRCPSHEMEATLKRLRDIPGYPRTVYVFFSDGKGVGFKDAIESVLADPTLRRMEIAGVVSRHAGFITTHWGSIRETIRNDDRGEMIEQMLSRLEKTTEDS